MVQRVYRTAHRIDQGEEGNAILSFPSVIDGISAIQYSQSVMGKRAYIETWGCQMNLHQSEGIAGVLQRAGYTLVEEIEEADIVLFNGCMIRQKAEEKVYGRIGAVVEEKRKRSVLLGIGGCLGHLRGDSLLERFPAVDFVFGSRGHGSLPERIEQLRRTGGRLPAQDPPTIEEVPFSRKSSVTAMVTIAEGCSNFCSYCIVPYARGPMRSRAPALVVREVEHLVSAGFQEVLLLGQNVNSYGRDRPEFGGFAELLDWVARTRIPRVRFTTSHPRDMTVDVLKTMAARDNVCNHLHLPCQSGSDRILQAMQRGYNRGQYRSIVDAVRDVVEGVNLTTDIIVGYPGETESDFADTMRLIEEVRFGSIFAAKYSPRPLTRSALVEDDVSEGTKNERLQRILSRQREIALEENERWVGRDVRVLIEGETRDGRLYGRADDHRTVVVEAGAIGELATVHVEGATASALAGSVLISAKGNS